MPGVISIVSNITGSACEDGLCDKSIFTLLSVANIQDKTSFINFLGIANCVLVGLLCVFLQYMRYIARLNKVEHDRRNISSSRYSILIEYVPSGWD